MGEGRGLPSRRGVAPTQWFPMHNQVIGRLRAALDADILDDGAEARVTFDPQRLGPAPGELTINDLRHAMSLHGIKAGLIPDAVKSLLASLQSGRPAVDIVVARATLAVEGTPGRVDLAASHKLIEKGEVAARVINPVLGRRGRDVRGREIPPASIHPPDVPLAGKNVEFDPTTFLYLATCRGRPSLDGRVLNVVPLKVVEGGLPEGAAPIEFEGDVEVRGSVGSGVSITAASVFVAGDVERGAQIHARRQIDVRGSLRIGRQAAGITCEGGARFRSIEGARVLAGGDVRVDETVIDAEVRSRMRIDARRATVRGSDLEAVDGVHVGSVPAEAGERVRLAAGVIQEDADRIVELRSRIAMESNRERDLVLEFAAEYGQAAPGRQASARSGDASEEEADRIRARETFLERRREIQESISALSVELTELEARQRRNERAIVRVEEAVLPPCSIRICGRDVEIQAPFSAVVFSFSSAQIEVLSIEQFERKEFQRRQDPEGLEEALACDRISPAAFAAGLRRLAESDDPLRARTAVRLALQILSLSGFDTPSAIAATARALGYLLGSAEKLEEGDHLYQQTLTLIGPLTSARAFDPLVFSIRGMLHAAQERFSEAIADHRAAVQLAASQSKRKPSDPSIHLHYAASVFKAFNRLPPEGLAKGKPLLDLASYEVKRFLTGRPSGPLRDRGLYLDQCIEECRQLVTKIEATGAPAVVMH